MSAFLQVAVAQAAIAISVFNLMIYLWLGLTVLLNGNRQSRVTWVGGIGLLAAALFFLCHGALVGAGVPGGPSPVDVWWRLAWAWRGGGEEPDGPGPDESLTLILRLAGTTRTS